MIEILILYAVNKRERTLYSIRKDIIDLFGEFTKPSIGSLYPALKRLVKENAVNVYEKISEGGKKFCYFSMAENGHEVFKKYFFDLKSSNPSVFFNELYSRLAVLGMLETKYKKEFVIESIKQIELFLAELNKKSKDEYLELDYYQRSLLNRTISELKSLKDYIKKLRVEDVM
mgnify:CR=1 FL=1